MQAAAEAGCKPFRMSDKDQACPGFCHQLAHQGKHRVSRRLIQIARRLIGQHQPRLWCQRAGDSHALLLPAGQLFGILPQLPCKAQPCGQQLHAVRVIPPCKPRLKRDVGRNRQRGDQVKLLKDHANSTTPQGRSPQIIQRRKVSAINRNDAIVGRIEATCQMQKRAFPRPGFACQGQHFSRLQIQ